MAPLSTIRIRRASGSLAGSSASAIVFDAAICPRSQARDVPRPFKRRFVQDSRALRASIPLSAIHAISNSRNEKRSRGGVLLRLCQIDERRPETCSGLNADGRLTKSNYWTSRQFLPAWICCAKHARARAWALLRAPTDTGSCNSRSSGHEARDAGLKAGRCAPLDRCSPEK